jgi:hypothetical protein
MTKKPSLGRTGPLGPSRFTSDERSPNGAPSGRAPPYRTSLMIWILAIGHSDRSNESGCGHENGMDALRGTAGPAISIYS